MTAWITVVGLGEDGLSGLAPSARAAVDAARVLIGSERLLGMIPLGPARRVPWPTPFNVRAVLDPLRGSPVVVLATGDPLNYGVGKSILAAYPAADVTFHPGISAFSLAAARMGWPLQDVATVSLHGRDASLIEPLIAPGVRILALTEGDRTVREVARRLVRRGYGGSSLTALEHIGGRDEHRRNFSADAVPEQAFRDLLTLAIECTAAPGAELLPRSPGLPDSAFKHDGLITKQDVRAITVAALAPYPHGLLWDVGAGCGSIAIEWMRAARGACATAFERESHRLAHIVENAQALGTPTLRLVAGELPATLSIDERPDAVFIGGALGVPGVFERSWKALKPGGRMVANVVTLEGEAHLMDLQAAHGGELLRIDLAYLTPLGPFRSMRARLPVMQWRGSKQ